MKEKHFTWPGRLKNNPEHDLINAYFTIDIQKSSEWVTELLQKTKSVRSGQMQSWERIGNAYCLRLYSNHIEIEEDYTEAAGSITKIPITDWEAALTAWQNFISK
tara:strand:+ start:1813 stop:2127 length:315 start_codon:yes stop_codon:yes gene_type:complete